MQMESTMFSLDEANRFGKDAMDNMLKSYSSMTQGLQTLSSEATDYSKKAYEDSTAAVEKLFSAKSLDKAFEIQSSYAKSAYEDFVAQATKMSELYVDFMRTAYKPFEAQAEKAVESAAKESAPKKAA
jgi:phasin family protein